MAMDIRKFQHACLELTKDSLSLVIDPGDWTKDFEANDHTVGVVITHEHGDHFDPRHLEAIRNKNPEVCIFAHVDIIAQLNDFAGRTQAVAVGETVAIGPFSLRFTGGIHAPIHPHYPVPPNLGVVVDNGKLYYPGDSYALPECQVEVLAVPASAPWMKLSDAMDFIVNVKPLTYFPTHDILLSDEGHALTKSWLERAASTVGATYKAITTA